MQAVIDNLAHEFRFDAALAAAHLFCISPDPALLTKQHRLATLLGAAMDEAAWGVARTDALAFSAIIDLQAQLDAIDAASAASGQPCTPTGLTATSPLVS
jgi:hypothetical protein